MFDFFFWFMNRDQRVKVPFLKNHPFCNMFVAFLLGFINVVLYSVLIVIPFFKDTSQSELYFLSKNNRNYSFIIFFFEALLVLVAFPFLLVKVRLFFFNSKACQTVPIDPKDPERYALSAYIKSRR